MPKLSDLLIEAFEKEEIASAEKKISVNPFVSKFATWYEKLRNAMDYNEEEVILRAAIQRILKRRLLFGGTGNTIAEPLVLELVWARYFPNDFLPTSSIDKVAKEIDLFIELRNQILKKKQAKEDAANEWMFDLMSSSLVHILSQNKTKDTMSNFMFHVLRNNIVVSDDSEETRDVQVFLAVRRSFDKDDLPFLRYHLFTQIYGRLTEENIESIAESFGKGIEEMQRQITYPQKDRIYTYVKRKTAIFLILEDILKEQRGKIRDLCFKEKDLRKVVFAACEKRYDGVRTKVQTAIIRSVVFLILTKAIFALAVESSFENLVYGKVSWNAILLNTSIPPILMIIVGLFLRSPGKDNSEKIFSFIQMALCKGEYLLGPVFEVKKSPPKVTPMLNIIFTLLWLLAITISFGTIIFILSKLHFTAISQGVFLFFAAIVSFLSYRIWLIPRAYTVFDKQSFFGPLFDFFFMPIVRVGRQLTEGISQLNILIFIFDFIFETPFKGLFAFFEQWFFFLRTKREELG